MRATTTEKACSNRPPPFAGPAILPRMPSAGSGEQMLKQGTAQFDRALAPPSPGREPRHLAHHLKIRNERTQSAPTSRQNVGRERPTQ